MSRVAQVSRRVIPGSRARRHEGTRSKAGGARPRDQQFVCVSWA